MFVSDDKALKYHLDQKQEVDLEKEYGIEHLVDSLEGDFIHLICFIKVKNIIKQWLKSLKKI